MSTDTPSSSMAPDDQCCVVDENSPAVRSPNQETTTSSSSLVAEPPCALVASSTSTHVLDSLIMPQFIDRTTIQELMINLHGFFNSTGLGNVADLLKQELESKGLIPQRYAFDGRQRPQSFDDFIGQFQGYQTDLLQMLSCLNMQTNAIVPPSIVNLPVRLFSGPRNSLIRRGLSTKKTFTLNSNLARPHFKSLETCKSVNVLMARELGMPIPPRLLQRKQAITNINDHGKLHGHILPVFCVTFDQTGRYVLTGGDDKLIKVWDIVYGRLRYTFRGHTAEISDLGINAENNCLASGSNDKTVRVWNAGNGQPLMVYRKHTALITMVRFTDFIDGDIRYLVSTGNDCIVAFYRYNISTMTFDPEPIRYEERESPSARGLVLNSSFGGNFVVMGDSANSIHIYKLSAHTVDRIAEFKAHDEKVDSLIFANSHLRFATGSKDGLAKVWEFSSGEWVSTELKVQNPPPQQLQNSTCQPSTSRKNATYKLTMLGWSGDDTRLITIGSDFLVRVWDWKSGQMLRKMEGHTNEVFVIKTHPVHNDLIFTAGHDGLLMLWDISTGQNLWRQKNQLDLHSAAVAIFDLAVSPQGDRYAYVDINGMLTLLGIGENKNCANSLRQQFFSTDYDEMFFDQNGFVQDVDEIPGHLALPALLVNADTHPYGPDIQRQVPGRDFLNPNKIQNPWSDRQILPAIPLKGQWLNRMEKSRIELAEYEAGKPLDEGEIERRRRVEEERKKQAHLDRLEKQRNRRNRNRQENDERMQQLMRPQYIIDENFTDTDSTYSGGDPSSFDDLDELSHEDFAEDFDSDYEEGDPGRETVFRNRSALTVTGRRKKNIGVRRNTEENSQQLPEDQPSTSQATQITRYGRTTKPPNRIENEYEESARVSRRRAGPSSSIAEPSTSNQQPNTRQRSRRVQIEEESDESRSPPDEEDYELVETQPTTSRGRSERTQRQISSADEEDLEPNLEALDEEMDEENSCPETPEGSLSRSSEGSDAEVKYSEDENSGGDDHIKRPQKRSSRVSPKRSQRTRKQQSSSRSPLTDHSFESSTQHSKVHVLKSGRESRPPKTFIKDETLNRGNRRKKVPSPQRRSKRQAEHHYNFQYDDEEFEYNERHVNGNGRNGIRSRRRTEKKHYNEQSGDERSESPVPGSSYRFTKTPQSKRLRERMLNKFPTLSYPDWIISSERRRFPYVAQLGDKVVYFVQGHRNYIQQSQIRPAHHYEKEIELYTAEEFFIVTDINYTEKDDVIVQSVELSHLTNEKRDGKKLKFCFHDQKDCPDFLFLNQHYVKSCNYNFKPGDRVEMVLIDNIYTGKIKFHNSIDPSYPHSEWNAILAEWEDGNTEECGIWDIRPAKPNRLKQEPVTVEDIDELGSYDPEPGDWSLLNENETLIETRGRYMDRCLKAINELTELPELAAFVDMIDLHEYSDYYARIKRPVYLQLIVDRIRTNYYRSLISLKFDIQQIGRNAKKYNSPGASIIQLSNLLVTTLFDMLDDHSIPSAQAYFMHLSESDTNVQLRHNEKLIPDIVATTNADGPSTSTATSSTASDSWQSQCRSLMNEFMTKNLSHQPNSLKETINQACERMHSRTEFDSPKEFMQAVQDLMNQEKESLDRKERRYGELVHSSNVLENQFKSIVSQHKRTEDARRTRNTTRAESSHNTRGESEKRVLRSQAQQRHDEEEASTSKRRRLR